MGRPLSLEKRIDRFFAHRPRSVAETKQFFIHRLKLPDKEIERQIDKLSRVGMLNDEAFVAWWINERTHKRPRSQALIKRELLQKGVDRQLIDKLQTDLQIKDTTTIKTLIRSKSKIIEKKYDEQTRMRRFIQYLMRRGYSYSTSVRALEDYYRKM